MMMSRVEKLLESTQKLWIFKARQWSRTRGSGLWEVAEVFKALATFSWIHWTALEELWMLRNSESAYWVVYHVVACFKANFCLCRNHCNISPIHFPMVVCWNNMQTQQWWRDCEKQWISENHYFLRYWSSNGGAFSTQILRNFSTKNKENHGPIFNPWIRTSISGEPIHSSCFPTISMMQILIMKRNKDVF